MHRSLQVAQLAVLLLLAFILGAVAWHLPGWLRGIDRLQATAQVAASSLKEAADTSNLASTQSLNLLGSTTKLVDHATRQVDALGPTIQHVNRVTDDLEVVVLNLNTALVNQDKNLSASLADLDRALKEMAPAMRAATATMENAAKATGDPAILETLHHVDETTANVAATTASLNRSAQMIEQKVHAMTKPASWAQRVGTTILDLGSKARILIVGP